MWTFYVIILGVYQINIYKYVLWNVIPSPTVNSQKDFLVLILSEGKEWRYGRTLPGQMHALVTSYSTASRRFFCLNVIMYLNYKKEFFLKNEVIIILSLIWGLTSSEPPWQNKPMCPWVLLSSHLTLSTRFQIIYCLQNKKSVSLVVSRFKVRLLKYLLIFRIYYHWS